MNEKRLNNVINKLNSFDFDAMVCIDFNNIKYLSNYSPTSFAICILKEDPIILSSAMDMEIATETSEIPVKEFKSFSDLKELFKKEKSKNSENFKKIAIESNLPVSIYNKLEGPWELAISDILQDIRMVKDKNEIAIMKEATTISHKSFKELNIQELQEKGITEGEAAYKLGYLMREDGAEKESFETIIASGSNSSLPHAKTEHKKLEAPILMDWGCKYNSYCSDTSRTIPYTEYQEEIFDIVLEAHNKAIKAIKPGIAACEIDNVARSIIADYGFEDNFIHSTGHSLGLDIHESPSISKKDNTILKENMVITIEPGIYFEGKFGVR
ncbi:MAG: aminopeptidase P family protein, partial [Methanobrevibacter sp.]|nr:aminopeptidase P family protein [Methanobrevibacter sp.]